jgi:hypothetical protein
MLKKRASSRSPSRPHPSAMAGLHIRGAILPQMLTAET